MLELEPRPYPTPEAARLRVLTIDDDVLWTKVIGRALAARDIAVEIHHDPVAGIARAAASDDHDAILLDVSLPGTSGLDVLKRIREAGVTAAVIMLTGDNTASTAAACFRAGAFHYLTKPACSEELIATIEAAGHQTAMRRRLRKLERDAQVAAFGPVLVGQSPAMRKLQAAIERLARTDVSVLIQGESGTGKELAARALHELGARNERPFVPVNCGAIPESLIDSELFGHNRGAFTGAAEARPGLFVQADGGTLFLDEIGDMPMAVQSRLLRTLQEREVRPLGGQGVRSIDVRVVAATHVDLQRAVDEHRFRQDLFFRFNVVTLWLPPLRDRLADIPLLAAHFLRKHHGTAPPELSPSALEVLMAYRWPGNVRELHNALLHAIALGGDGVIAVEALPARIREPDLGVAAQDPVLFTDAKRVAIAHFERGYLETILRRTQGNVSESARQAGLDRANFRRHLQRYGLDPSRFRG